MSVESPHSVTHSGRSRAPAVLAELIVECASRRAESRGLHYTTDHPARDDARWRCDIVLRKAPDGIAATFDRRPFSGGR